MANIEQIPVKCVIMRGGTSKAIFLRRELLPVDKVARDRLIMRIFGSPDPRQIDGLGGADILTSKLAIVGPSTVSDADVDYLFGQVGIETSGINYHENCGNIISAVGAYAIQEGLVKGSINETRVRVNNINTKKIIDVFVPMRDGEPAVDGDFAIDGVPGTGAETWVDFRNSSGASTGTVLPTGNVRDDLFIPEFSRKVTVSIVDVGKVTLFFNAAEAGITGTETPEQFTPEILDRFWAIRLAAARLIGTPLDSALPTPVSVTSPVSHSLFLPGQKLARSDCDLIGRRVFGPPPKLHKAFAGTGAVCTAVAALIPGTVVHAVTKQQTLGLIRLAHPSGIFRVRARVEVVKGQVKVQEASYSRTVRRIMEGCVFVPASLA